jgi:glycosyltransferase involved in cell wall biosynthesis
MCIRKDVDMDEPLVSVIIPAHNGAAWLDDCLQSVLGQCYPRTEVLVINDGSSDDTPLVLARYQSRIRVVHQAQCGIGAARNRGLEQATGEFIAFLDQDDCWRTDKLSIQVRQALAQPNQVISYTDAEEFDEHGTVHPSFFRLFPGLQQPAGIFDEIIGLAVPLMSTVLMRRRWLESQQLRFFEPASGVDDVGLFLEVADRGGRFGVIKEQLSFRRLHATNLSKSHCHRFQKRICLYRHLLERLDKPEHRRSVRRGLRDACYRVAEWHWGRLELEPARQYFRQARGLDRLGLRAGGFELASRLPRPVVGCLQKTKRALVG